jgi:hypothetical protein
MTKSEYDAKNRERPQSAAETLYRNRDKSERARREDYANELRAEKLANSRATTSTPHLVQQKSITTDENANSPLLKLKTGGFLRTDLKDYLNKKQEKVTCISCLNCIKPKDQTISYRYPAEMQS